MGNGLITNNCARDKIRGEGKRH